MGRKISIGSEVDFLAVVQRGGCKRIRLQACGSCPPASWLLHANAFSESIFFCSTHTNTRNIFWYHSALPTIPY